MGICSVNDYHTWYCGWCDTKNLIPRTRVEEGTATCGACHRKAAPADLLGEEDALAVNG